MLVVIDEPNPTLARRELASALRKTREQRGRSLDDLASFLGVTAPQASRLDSAARGYQPRDVERLVEWFGLDGAERARLLELAREARKRAWWQKVDLADAYRTLIGLEHAARSISEYTTNVVPGLLQTREYARVQVSSWSADIPREVVEQAVATRMRRQRVLDGHPAPILKVVIDEVALVRAPRDPAIRRAQFAHLLEMSDRSGVTVQVIGREVGMHPGTNQHLILLELAGLPDVAYTEVLLEPTIVEQEDKVREYRKLWDELRAVALDPIASRDRIVSYLPGTP